MAAIARSSSLVTKRPGHLEIIAVSLAGLSILLGATFIWGFAAFPLGIAATVIALIVRHRSSAQGEETPLLATIALVLGPIGSVLAICVVILLFTVAPLLRDTVATTINPIQHSIAADIHSINKDEAQRIKQAKQYQATFEHDLNQINSDLQSRVGILADVSKQAAKDVTGLRSDLSNLEQSTRQESSSIHGSIDSLSGSLASIKADMATIQRELAYLCAKPSASCPS